MEIMKYHDCAGAWRTVNSAAADPRINHEPARAFIPKSTPKLPLRGLLSGQSQAEVALTQISKNSPPPVRDGTKVAVQDRRQESLPRRTLTDRGFYPMAGDAI